jgi:hypothetical protein
MASTAKAVVIAGETLTLMSGNKPVSMSHSPSKIVPTLLPAKLLPSFMVPPIDFALKVKCLQYEDRSIPVGVQDADNDLFHLKFLPTSVATA